MSLVRLKLGREKSLLRRHPWIFSGAIDSVEGTSVNLAGTLLWMGKYSCIGERWRVRGLVRNHNLRLTYVQAALQFLVWEEAAPAYGTS